MSDGSKSSSSFNPMDSESCDPIYISMHNGSILSKYPNARNLTVALVAQIYGSAICCLKCHSDQQT